MCCLYIKLHVHENKYKEAGLEIPCQTYVAEYSGIKFNQQPVMITRRFAGLSCFVQELFQLHNL